MASIHRRSAAHPGRALALLAAGTLFAGAAAPAAAMGLAPHRAVYDMSLERAATGSGINQVSGRMAFEMIGSACDGYTVNMRFMSQIQGEQRSNTTDLQSATFEAGDGSTYRFVTRNRFDGGGPEVTDGIAERTGDAIVVDLSEPEATRVELARGVLFPTQHIRKILAAAKQGERILPAEVYDGSDGGTKRYQTTTAIGKRGVVKDAPGPAAENLRDVARWPVTIAYFDETADNGGETPSYEFSYSLHENGVSTDLVLDYGNFAIRGTLAELEFVDVPECGD